jgi:hypothetical protein
VLGNPRRIVSTGAYYGPVPRKYATVLQQQPDETMAKYVMLN